uniref:Transcription initiation factor IIF subunit alpha n=1 Tax=Ascaris suum TaxID=6253 RepID=F1KX07_ASCSU
MASPVRSTEYAVHVRRPIKDKQYSVLAFSESAMLNLADWKNASFSVRMRREDSEKQAAATEPRQSYGAGSEYGSAARQEARRKKYGRQMQKFQIDAQPWQLSIRYENGKERKFRGVRGGGVGEHADYWVLLHQSGRIEAVKVSGWYRLLPTANLSLDEETLQRRCREIDLAALRAKLMRRSKGASDIDDEMASESNVTSGEVHGDEGGRVSNSSNHSKTKRKMRKPHKNERKVMRDVVEVASYDSDDGDEEGREFDYISDNTSDSDEDFNKMERKVDEAMVAVADEKGLREMIEGGLSESDGSDDDVDANMRRLLKLDAKDEDEEIGSLQDNEERGSSNSDSDDPDKGVTSAIFLPLKKVPSKEGPTKVRVKRRLQETLAGSIDTENFNQFKARRCDPQVGTSSTNDDSSCQIIHREYRHSTQLL